MRCLIGYSYNHLQRIARLFPELKVHRSVSWFEVERMERILNSPGQTRRFPPCGFRRRRGKVESSGFRGVNGMVLLNRLPAIPSTNIVLHRGHPSRPPFGAQPRRGLDGTRPRREETQDAGMAGFVLAPHLKAELSA